MEKGRKAWFKIKKTVGLNNPCNLLEKLFELNTMAFDFSWFTSSFQEEHNLLNTFKEFCSPSCVRLV
jgi:hypothetical protein